MPSNRVSVTSPVEISFSTTYSQSATVWRFLLVTWAEEIPFIPRHYGAFYRFCPLTKISSLNAAIRAISQKMPVNNPMTFRSFTVS